MTEDELSISGDAAREFFRGPHGLVKAANMKRVTTANNARESFAGCAQHIDVWIKFRRVSHRSTDMHEHLAGTVASTGCFDDICPEHASGAEFCDFGKEVRSCRE